MRHKKSNPIVLLAIMAACFTVSCKKEQGIQSAPPPPPEPARLLVKITDPLSPGTPLNFKYDAAGRLTETQILNSVSKYSYANNIFHGQFFDHNSYLYCDYENGKLDNTGKLLEATRVIHDPVLPDQKDKDVYTYNAEGYITKWTRTYTATGEILSTDFMYTNGNLSTLVNSQNGQPYRRVEYTYYDNLLNKLTLDLEKNIANYITDAFTGKRSKNLMKTKMIYDAQNVKLTDNLYTYEVDAKGYPVKVKLKSQISNYEADQVYEYNN